MQEDDHHAPKMGSDRSFGFVFAAFFAAVAAYRVFKGLHSAWLFVALAVAFAAAALIAPRLMRPLNVLWFRLGLLLNRIVSPLVLAVAFFGVIVPLAWIARLCGKDGLHLRRTDAQSYWQHRNPPGPTGESMTKQF
jgi:hypothetical protein